MWANNSRLWTQVNTRRVRRTRWFRVTGPLLDQPGSTPLSSWRIQHNQKTRPRARLAHTLFLTCSAISFRRSSIANILASACLLSRISLSAALHRAVIGKVFSSPGRARRGVGVWGLTVGVNQKRIVERTAFACEMGPCCSCQRLCPGHIASMNEQTLYLGHTGAMLAIV